MDVEVAEKVEHINSPDEESALQASVVFLLRMSPFFFDYKLRMYQVCLQEQRKSENVLDYLHGSDQLTGRHCLKPIRLQKSSTQATVQSFTIILGRKPGRSFVHQRVGYILHSTLQSTS
ncbi:hypothetical protein Mapa_001476 [Marchantia paleacea]|nr:hypothetical protein Mapa_001476 [Marchantia paleacea]